MKPYPICKAAVIGAGVMGAGIAAVIANAGIPVCLLDIVPPTLTDEDKKAGLNENSPVFLNKFALAGLKRIVDVRRGALFTPELATLITVGNLEHDLHLLRDCDWVVEVVPEDLQIKKNLLKKIIPWCKNTAIVSTNTSGVSVTAISAEMPPDLQYRFLGTHFFNPPRQMRLFELIPGRNTDPAITEFMTGFGKERLGKGVVRAKDTPNFIGNRIGVFAFVSVLQAAEEFGFDIETADALTGPVLGRPKSATYRTIDMVGIDVLAHVCDNLRGTLPAEEAAIFSLTPPLRTLLDCKYLGDKSGGGSYKTLQEGDVTQKLIWDKKTYLPLRKPKISVLEQTKKLPFAQRLWAVIDSRTREGDFVWRIVKELLLYSASRVPEIADDHAAIDRAMEWGYNWQMGPFALWNKLGFEKVAQRLTSEGTVLPAWVQKRLEAGLSFYPAAQTAASKPTLLSNAVSDLVDMGDGVLCLQMHPKGCAIGMDLMASIHAAMDVLEQQPEWEGLVLASTGKNFLNGADLYTFVTDINEQAWNRISSIVDRFHATSLRLKYAKKPVVAAVHGMALGGGLEFAMHCSRVVAHCEVNLGLVEFNVGVLPAGGGCKELLYRYMSQLEGIPGADPTPAVIQAWRQIATAQVSKNALEAVKLCYLRPVDRIVMDIDSLVGEAKREVLHLSASGFRQVAPKPITVTGATGYGCLSVLMDGMKQGNFISAYDEVIGREVATVFTGGDAPYGTVLTEDQLMTLEARGFLNLIRQEKTLARIEGMLQTGKPLRN